MITALKKTRISQFKQLNNPGFVYYHGRPSNQTLKVDPHDRPSN